MEATIRIHRPILTKEEAEMRMEQLKAAITDILKEVHHEEKKQKNKN